VVALWSFGETVALCVADAAADIVMDVLCSREPNSQPVQLCGMRADAEQKSWQTHADHEQKRKGKEKEEKTGQKKTPTGEAVAI